MIGHASNCGRSLALIQSQNRTVVMRIEVFRRPYHFGSGIERLPYIVMIAAYRVCDDG